MERDDSAPITALLHRHRGNRAAFDELVSLVYHRLRRIARGQLARGGVECPAARARLVALRALDPAGSSAPA